MASHCSSRRGRRVWTGCCARSWCWPEPLAVYDPAKGLFTFEGVRALGASLAGWTSRSSGGGSRSKQAFKTWLADRPQAWRDAVQVVAIAGFTG